MIPPELLVAEERPARIAELERQIAREWRRFAITEAIVIWLPFAVFLAVYVLTDAISADAVAPIALVVFGLPAGLLTLYWVFRRVRPLQREIDELRRLGSS